MTVKGYLLSLPERVARSALGLGAGTARELGQVALPAVREGRLYQNLVEATLRFLIEQVGGVATVRTGARMRCPPTSSRAAARETLSKRWASWRSARRPCGSWRR
jgi:hypothetical protein